MVVPLGNSESIHNTAAKQLSRWLSVLVAEALITLAAPRQNYYRLNEEAESTRDWKKKPLQSGRRVIPAGLLLASQIVNSVKGHFKFVFASEFLGG